ncbi:dTMP kinase [Rhizorhapis suberifaciens]|uniref:Thymidylate kinase n=1 Tax=Rhizorhapis suberifaciens TaxID=13656 RepID=A0A840HUF5_9SPHN|nr:dTMP kinase [Rhizorhapis suberifaciens]MBB4641227.1 dTMP kinase [Rhizorhapis suberifaciens]
MSGRFITLEGGEGAGKSTQLKALAKALQERGLEVVTTREPGGSAGAEAIRGLLLKGDGDRWNARAEALLFAAARADHVEKTILPALKAGKWVICDRFLDSSRAYQSEGSGLDDADIQTLHRFGSEGLLPDRTLVLQLPQEQAERRATVRDGGTTDRFSGRNNDFHRKVAEAFDRYAAQEPERFRIVDASGSTAIVTSLLIDALSDLLP